MPSASGGFTGTEIVERVKNFVGNQTSTFQQYVEESLPLAEYRFCKLHDWKFLRRVGIDLSITNGTAEYTLDSLSSGGDTFGMDAENVDLIYDETNGAVLRKVEIAYLRRVDSEADDGSANDRPQFWAVTGRQSIRFWPPIFANATLKIDGKVSPNALLTLSNNPIIPYKYQESFIEYVIAMALSRENDDRAPAKKQEAMALIRADIQDDLSEAGSSDDPRMKSMLENRFDGAGTTIESLLFPYYEG